MPGWCKLSLYHSTALPNQLSLCLWSLDCLVQVKSLHLYTQSISYVFNPDPARRPGLHHPGLRAARLTCPSSERRGKKQQHTSLRQDLISVSAFLKTSKRNFRTDQSGKKVKLHARKSKLSFRTSRFAKNVKLDELKRYKLNFRTGKFGKKPVCARITFPSFPRRGGNGAAMPGWCKLSLYHSTALPNQLALRSWSLDVWSK